MHLGRFNKAIEMLTDIYQKMNYVQRFDSLISSLHVVASHPGNVEYANAYKGELEAFRQILLQSELNSPRPGLQSILASIDAEQYIGNKLFQKVMDAISENPATPSLALNGIQKLKDQTVAFYSNVVLLDTVFQALSVEYDSLDEEEGEIGILIPRDLNSSTLICVSKEFKDWSTILSPLTELFDPVAKPLQIRTCATTDFTVYLAATYLVIRGIAECLKGLNMILSEINSTRELIEQLSSKIAAPEEIDKLKENNKQKLNNEIRKFAEKTVDDNYKESDESRKNELKNAVNQSLKKIIEKISGGAKIELKYIAPKKQENGTDSQEVNSQQEKENFAIELDEQILLIDFSESKSHVLALLENNYDELNKDDAEA